MDHYDAVFGKNNSDQLRELEEHWDRWSLVTKVAICACGNEVKLIGQHDVKLIRCPACFVVGRFTVEVEDD
jgi:hypothetical protein